jgi:hypothetical protein
MMTSRDSSLAAHSGNVEPTTSKTAVVRYALFKVISRNYRASPNDSASAFALVNDDTNRYYQILKDQWLDDPDEILDIKSADW